MSAQQQRHLPPEALAGWFSEVAELLEVDRQVNPDGDIGAVLDLTKELSTTVARPAGPLTMFLLGIALGGRVQPGEQVGPYLAELEPRVRALAAERGEELMSATTADVEREQ